MSPFPSPAALRFLLLFLPPLMICPRPAASGADRHSPATPVEAACNLAWPSPDDRPAYDACIATLRSVPETRSAGLPRLAVISTEIAVGDAAGVAGYVQTLLRKERKEAGPDDGRCLGSCLWFYKDAVAGMRRSVEQMGRGLYANAGEALDAALDDVLGCGLCFQGAGTENPVEKQNGELYSVIMIGAAICHELAKV